MSVVVKKEGSEQTYVSRTVEHILNVNGKKILVRTSYMDSIYGDNDFDTEIVEDEVSKTLTEEERDALGDELDTLIDLKDGEETTIEGYETN
jgi:hypothetical protein